MEDDLGEAKIHFGKICAKQKHVDKWWKLKGKGIESGKIHLGLHRLDQIKKEEINEEEPYMAVLQFYLKEAEGIFIDTDEYEQGEQRYHAVVEISGAEGTTLDLGYGKIEPEEKHNFVTFDQAAYTILKQVPKDLSCSLKIYLVKSKNNDGDRFLAEGSFEIGEEETRLTHRTPFDSNGKTSIFGRIMLQYYQ